MYLQVLTMVAIIFLQMAYFDLMKKRREMSFSECCNCVIFLLLINKRYSSCSESL